MSLGSRPSLEVSSKKGDSDENEQRYSKTVKVLRSMLLVEDSAQIKLTDSPHPAIEVSAVSKPFSRNNCRCIFLKLGDYILD